MAEIRIIVTSQYGLRRMMAYQTDGWNNPTFYAEKDVSGNLIIDAPGKWLLCGTDSNKQVVTSLLIVKQNGDYRLRGDTQYFMVIKQ